MLEIGIKGKEEVMVTENNSAIAMESGTLKVFDACNGSFNGKNGMEKRCPFFRKRSVYSRNKA